MVDAGGAQSVGAVVLAYHPEDTLIDSVGSLAPQVGLVVVVNNSPDAASAVIEQLRLMPGVEVLDQAGNVGVAAGFNAGMRRVFDVGHGFAIIFDQDSTVTDGFVQSLVDAHTACATPVGVVGPALRSVATGRIYARETGQGAVPVDMLISSGSLFSRALVEAIGLHDEPLFIDYVDHDICLRANKHGYRNLKVFDALLDHRFGDSDPVKLFGRLVYLANYSPLRHYYATRNRIVVIRRFGFGTWFWADLWFTAKAWVKMLLCERGRRAKVRAALRGARDGFRYPARTLRW